MSQGRGQPRGAFNLRGNDRRRPRPLLLVDSCRETQENRNGKETHKKDTRQGKGGGRGKRSEDDETQVEVRSKVRKVRRRARGRRKEK